MLAASVTCQGFDLCLPTEDYHVDRTAALRHRPTSQPSGSSVGLGGVPRAEPAVQRPRPVDSARNWLRGRRLLVVPGRGSGALPLLGKVFAVGVAYGSVKQHADA